MLEKLVAFSLHRRALVLVITLVLVGLGIWSASRLPVDAMPDITNPQIQINSEVPALAPEEIETLVTVPLELEMAGLPGMIELRSLSKFGLSQITMTFADGVDIYRLRQLVAERLQQARDRIPSDITPILAPLSTGLGEIVYYTVDYRADAADIPADRAEQLRQLRLLHDYTIKPLLRSTPGLAEVNAIGGYERQVVVQPDPAKLAEAGVSFDDLIATVAASTENTGGGILELGGESVIVRADTRARDPVDISDLPVKFAGGARPLLVSDLATVTIGSAVRTGASTVDGEETVTGAAIMLADGNARAIARAVTTRLDEIAQLLPAKAAINVVYDRSDLVDATIRTVELNLLEGAALVAAVLFLFLGHVRAAFIVVLVIPLSFLFMLSGLVGSRITANLMSLGAIDFGLIVDGAIVMVENALRHLAQRQHLLGRRLTHSERLHALRGSSREVARPMFFGVLIITLVYVPILALTGIEGKLFRPMAVAVMLALGAALALALTLVPALCTWLLRGEFKETDGGLVRITKAIYTPLLAAALRLRVLVVAAALLLFVGAGWLFTRLGAEFVPQLDEGALSIQMIRGNSVALSDSVALQRDTERLLRERFPEISHLFARIGTAEIATDPMGPNVADTYVFFHPREQWREIDGHRITKPELIELIRDELVSTIPGQAYLFTQPIQMRFNEIMAGARADLALKIYGHDHAELERLATAARDILRNIPGGGDVEFDVLGRTPVLDITPRREALRGLGLHADEINAAVGTALGGTAAGTLIDGERRYDVVVRLPEAMRHDIAALGDLPVVARDGAVQVPLSRIADFNVTSRVGTITREDTQRRVAILINVRGRDTESFVRDATQRLRAEIAFPPGYAFEFGGQFENLQAARTRLAIVVPAALALIFLLIYVSFGSLRQAALVFVSVPLAATGGVAALWLRDMPFTISAAVGFIALSGIAVLNGIMLISYINQLREGGATVRDAVVEGTLTRLRPKLMTALVASLGFVPMALATRLGAEVQRPVATVVIGGIVTSTFLTLLVLPVLYDWIESRTTRSVSGQPSVTES